MSESNTALAMQAAARPARLSLSPFACAIIAAIAIAAFLGTQLPHAGHVLNLVLPDADDAIRLLGVRDLLAGQSWFDTHQYRYLPPDGTLMHWSRLADAPLAAGIWLLTPLLGQNAAEGWVALAWPPLLFLVYLGIVAAALGRIAPRPTIAIAVLIACQMVVFQYLFRFGRIDHHALQIVLVTSAAICFAFAARSHAAALASGLFAALSLAIGLETLPFVAMIGVAHVLAWVYGEDNAAGAMLRFAAAFSAASLLAFGIQTAPALWTVPACDMLSAPFLLLTCGGGIVVAVLALASPALKTAAPRLAAAAAGGAALVGLFVAAYPACLSGPYEMVPQPYRDIWIGDIVEARAGWMRLGNGSVAIFQAFGPLLAAAGAAAVLALKSEGPTRRLMAVSAGCLWIGVALALMQVRGLYIVSAFVPPVAAIGSWRILETLGAARITAFRAAAAGLAALAFVGPVWSAPALAVRHLAPAFGPAERVPSDCLVKRNLSALDALPQGVILAPVDLGAYTLLYTRHSIIVGGFHRAVDGIIAGIDAFKGSEADMRRVAAEHRPDYLVLCADWARSDATPPDAFARALADGASAPWLEPVALDAGALMVWRVEATLRGSL